MKIKAKTLGGNELYTIWFTSVKMMRILATKWTIMRTCNEAQHDYRDGLQKFGTSIEQYEYSYSCVKFDGFNNKSSQ